MKKFIMCLYVIILMGSMIGCSGSVTPYQIEKSEELCKDDDGICYIMAKNKYKFITKCNSGIKFTTQIKRNTE